MRGIATGGSRGPKGADGANGVGVPVGGATGQVLAKNSNTDFDTGWVDAAAVPGEGAVGEYLYGKKLLFDNTLASAGNFDVSNISQDYDHLEFVLEGRTTNAVTEQGVFLILNNDSTAANYRETFNHLGSSQGNYVQDSNYIGSLVGSTGLAGQTGYIRCELPFYCSANRKNFRSQSQERRTESEIFNRLITGTWENTQAINRIAIVCDTGSIAAGSRLQIYGVGNRVTAQGVNTAYVGEQLFRQVVGAGGQATFDITAIPGGYDRLEIHVVGRSTALGAELLIEYNGDTTVANYGFVWDLSGQSSLSADSDGSNRIGYIVTSTSAAERFSSNKIVIQAYDSTTQHKVALSECNYPDGTDYWAAQMATTWKNTAPVNRITLKPNAGNFALGSICTVVGYRNRSLSQYSDYLASMGLTGTKTLTANTTTTLTFDATDFDSASMVSADRSYFSIPVNGIYEVTGHMKVGPVGGAVDFTLDLMQNSTSIHNGNWRVAGNQTGVHFQVMYKFNAGDHIMFKYTHWTPNTQLLAGTRFQIKRISQIY